MDLNQIAVFIHLAELTVIPMVLFRKKDVATTYAWVFFILLVPYVGALSYLLIGHNRVERRALKKSRANVRIAHRYAQDRPEEQPRPWKRLPPEDLEGQQRDIMSLALNASFFEPTPGNRTALFVEGEEAFSRMLQALRAATHHIHLEFYVFASDSTGREFADVLCEKARQGVQVRMLLDGVGCLKLSSALVRRLREAGVRVEFFMPIRKWNRFWNLNLRNHRKLLIIDGQLGFCGGLNVADVYRGRSLQYGPWQDAHMEVEGPAASQMQWVFAEDWYFTCGEELPTEYFAERPAAGQDLVQVIASGPDRDVEVMYEFFFTAITTARKSVWIITPYFVPDRAMLLALMTAARRGVEVRVLVPERCNHNVAQWAGRYYYEDLLEAGVSIFEYPDGMLHAKVMLVDGAWATVGSANMDIRSFRLNFEVNLLVFGQDFADRISTVFQRDLKISRPVLLAAFRRRGFKRRLLENFFRLLSPLL